MSISDLLQRPLCIGSLQLRNRVVMPPMTRNMCPEGVPNSAVAEYYASRARHGVGLIITEATPIGHPSACPDPNVAPMHGEKALAGWAKVVSAVHKSGAKIFSQLTHMGISVDGSGITQTPPGFIMSGPSGLRGPDGQRVTDPMTLDDIYDVIKAFVQAAVNAKNVGFDGIELHGAHGFLIDQFFWVVTNKRTDKFGGSTVAQRATFAVELIRAVREAVGPDFPIVLRLSQWKQQDYTARIFGTPDELNEFLTAISGAGVDAFDCSTRRFWEPAFDGSPLTVAGWVRKLSNKPTMAVGSVGLDSDLLGCNQDGKNNSEFLGDSAIALSSLERLEACLTRDEFDLIAIGRGLIADAEWVEKVISGRLNELVPFTRAALQTLA